MLSDSLMTSLVTSLVSKVTTDQYALFCLIIWCHKTHVPARLIITAVALFADLSVRQTAGLRLHRLVGSI